MTQQGRPEVLEAAARCAPEGMMYGAQRWGAAEGSYSALPTIPSIDPGIYGYSRTVLLIDCLRFLSKVLRSRPYESSLFYRLFFFLFFTISRQIITVIFCNYHDFDNDDDYLLLCTIKQILILYYNDYFFSANHGKDLFTSSLSTATTTKPTASSPKKLPHRLPAAFVKVGDWHLLRLFCPSPSDFPWWKGFGFSVGGADGWDGGWKKGEAVYLEAV